MNGNQFDDFYGQLDIENLEWREREKKIEKEGKRLQRFVLLLTTKKKSVLLYYVLYLKQWIKETSTSIFSSFKFPNVFLKKL